MTGGVDLPDPRMAVIAFCGAAGSGKDEAASVLIQRFGFVKRSFAEALRGEVRQAFVNPTLAAILYKQMPECVRLAYRTCLDGHDTDPWRKPTSPAMRELLQKWGTEFRRAQDDDYWVRLERIALPDVGNFVYTDVRFPNEYQMIRSVGGLVFKIERDGFKGNGHISESYWPTFDCDAVIGNNGTVEGFRQSVQRAISDIQCQNSPVDIFLPAQQHCQA